MSRRLMLAGASSRLAHLLPFAAAAVAGSAATRRAEEPPPAEETAEEPPAEEQPAAEDAPPADETTAEDPPTDETAEETDDDDADLEADDAEEEMQGPSAVARARQRECARCAAILAAAHPGNLQQAMVFAFDTRMTRQAAIKALGKAPPAAPSATRLNPRLPPSAGAAGPAPAAGAWDKSFAKAASAHGPRR